MGQAKNREKIYKENLNIIAESAKKFEDYSSFEDFPYRENKNLHSLKAYQHLMCLIFVRAKNLHEALIRAIEENNAYVSFLLIKAYWENTAMLGYIYITSRNLISKKDYKSLSDLITKHALGGKGFVTEEMVKRVGTTKEALTQVNLITWMQKVDKDFDREIGKGVSFSELEKIYNEFIAEGGHSIFLGLDLCEEKQADGSLRINPKKTAHFNDDKMTYNHLALMDNYFFFYWNKYQVDLKQWLESL